MTHRRHRSNSVRRQTTWVGPADQAYVSVADGTKVLLASFDPATSGLPKPTLIRARGGLSVVPGNFTADLAIIWAFGIAIVSDQALAAGIASIPGPFTNADWDGWQTWMSGSSRFEFITGAGVELQSETVQIDSKGMRKITDNETLVLVAESQSGAFDISMPLRTLLKLS